MIFQYYLSQVSIPHSFFVYDIMGRLIFKFAPIEFTIEYKHDNVRTIVMLRDVKKRKLIRSLVGKIIFEYDPDTCIVYHKNGNISTEIDVGLLQKKYHQIRTITINNRHSD